MNTHTSLALVIVSLAGESITVPESEAFDAADRLVARNGGGMPTFVKVNALPAMAPVGASTALTVVAPKAVPPVTLATRVSDAPRFSTFGTGGQVVDSCAAVRISAMQESLRSSGVKVNAGEQLFATGTRMAVEGYATQAARKAEHDCKLDLCDAASALRTAVQNEGRKDFEVSASDYADALDVANDGMGKIQAFGLSISEQALRGLTARIESPSLSYLLGIRERISAEMSLPRPSRNVDAIRADKARIVETLRHECKRAGNVALKVRARTNVGDMFAVVSPTYSPADAPEVLESIMKAMPSDAKGTWSYDPVSTAWELRAEVWTPTPTDMQAVGEPFSGYVSFQSKDNGTGRLNGGGGVLLLRCLNASTYTANSVKASRTHRGAIMLDVRSMLKTAMLSINALTLAWGVNRTTAVEVPSGLTLEDAIPGFWRHLLTSRQSELVGVLPGRSETRIDGLTRAFHAERRDSSRLVRSDFAQGWTKYIQSEETETRRAAEGAIGEWLARPSRMGCEMRAK